jgi:hypothetical protein
MYDLNISLIKYISFSTRNKNDFIDSITLPITTELTTKYYKRKTNKLSRGGFKQYNHKFSHRS